MLGPADLLHRLGALLKAWKLDRMLPTLLFGAAGGVLFVWLSVPLPWMLGAMAAVTIASLLRFDSYLPKGSAPSSSRCSAPCWAAPSSRSCSTTSAAGPSRCSA